MTSMNRIAVLRCEDCPRVFTDLGELAVHESNYGHGTWAEEWHGYRSRAAVGEENSQP